MYEIEKSYLYKVYDELNNFVGVWDDVTDELNFTHEINSAGSSTTVILARNSDSKNVSVSPILDNLNAAIVDNNDFAILGSDKSVPKVGPGSDVNYNNRVDVYVFYGLLEDILDNFDQPILDNNDEAIQSTIGAPQGIRKFTGFISEINTRYGDTENTSVTLMSYGYDLDQYLLTKSGNTTAAYNSYDPSQIARETLTQFTTDGAGNTFTTYSADSLLSTGTVVSYSFNTNTYLDMAKKVIELAPPNWLWYVGLGDNLYHLKPRPTTPDHKFILGKHIKSLELKSTIEGSVNDVVYIGGGTPAMFRRNKDTPAQYTRRGLKVISDSRVTVPSSADIISEAEMAQKNKIQYKSTVTILDKVYDIEKIGVGQLIGFGNFGNYVDALTMLVVGLSYAPDSVTLQLDTLAPDVSKRLQDMYRNLEDVAAGRAPVAPVNI